MLLVFNKDLEITEILKKSSEEGKTYLSKFSITKSLFKEMDFCPIIMRFEDEKDYYLDEDILQVKKGKSFLLEFDLPDKNEPFYYEDCLLLAKELFVTYKFPVKKNFIYETILRYTLEKTIH